jgi:hypothetical protein
MTRCGALRIFQRATALAHSPGSSANADQPCRASSPRLVSCVAVAVMPCGHSLARTCHRLVKGVDGKRFG